MNLLITRRPAQAKTLGDLLGEGWLIEAVPNAPRTLPVDRLGIDTDKRFRPEWVDDASMTAVIDRLKSKLARAEKLVLLTDGTPTDSSRIGHILAVLKPPRSVEVKIVQLGALTLSDWKTALENPLKLDADAMRAGEVRRVLDRLFAYLVSPVISKRLNQAMSLSRAEMTALTSLMPALDRWHVKLALEYPDKTDRLAYLEILRKDRWQTLTVSDAVRASQKRALFMTTLWLPETRPVPLTVARLMALAEAQLGWQPSETHHRLTVLLDAGHLRMKGDAITPQQDTVLREGELLTLYKLVADIEAHPLTRYRLNARTAQPLTVIAQHPPIVRGVHIQPVAYTSALLVNHLIDAGFPVEHAVAAIVSLVSRQLVSTHDGRLQLTPTGQKVTAELRDAFPSATDTRLSAHIAHHLTRIAAGNASPYLVMAGYWKLLKRELADALPQPVPAPVHFKPEGTPDDTA